MERGLLLNQHHAEPLGVNFSRWPNDIPYNFTSDLSPRTNDRYGKSSPPLRQRARQAHSNVSDLAMGDGIRDK